MSPDTLASFIYIFLFFQLSVYTIANEVVNPLLEYNSIGKITKEEIIVQIISQIQTISNLQSNTLQESIDTTSVLLDAFNKLEMNSYEGSKPVISVSIIVTCLTYLLSYFWKHIKFFKNSSACLDYKHDLLFKVFKFDC